MHWFFMHGEWSLRWIETRPVPAGRGVATHSIRTLSGFALALLVAGCICTGCDSLGGEVSESEVFEALSGTADAETMKAAVSRYLKGGGDPNAVIRNGETLLMKCSGYGLLDTCRMLVEFGADVNATDEVGYTALSSAACRWTDLCRELLAAGAAPCSESAWGDTPLFVAAECGNSEVVALLLSLGCDPNHAMEYGATALHAAAKGARDGDTIRILLESGADIEMMDNTYMTAFDIARYANADPDVLDLLRPPGQAERDRQMEEWAEGDYADLVPEEEVSALQTTAPQWFPEQCNVWNGFRVGDGMEDRLIEFSRLCGTQEEDIPLIKDMILEHYGALGWQEENVALVEGPFLPMSRIEYDVSLGLKTWYVTPADKLLISSESMEFVLFEFLVMREAEGLRKVFLRGVYVDEELAGYIIEASAGESEGFAEWSAALRKAIWPHPVLFFDTFLSHVSLTEMTGYEIPEG